VDGGRAIGRRATRTRGTGGRREDDYARLTVTSVDEQVHEARGVHEGVEGVREFLAAGRRRRV
jgi:hypothetical protein